MKRERRSFPIIAILMALVLSACALNGPQDSITTAMDGTDSISESAIPSVNPNVMVQRLGKGINMGNTLDAPTEGAWAKVAQQYYFDDYKNAGFNSVRIPVTWHKHLGTSSPYVVDAAFMSRVEQIVDWALARNLAVILNCHHEDWIRTNYPAVMVPRYESLWKQIATKFANKSENLVFEVQNEPFGLITAAQVNDLNSRALNIIRQTNPNRNVVLSGRGWNNYRQLITEVNFPQDSHLIANFHYYEPWNFAGEAQGTWGSAQQITTMKDDFKKVKDWSVQKNIPIMVNEFGVVKQADSASRIAWYKNICEISRANGFTYQAWDDSGKFGIYNRDGRTWETAVLNSLIGPDNATTGPAGYTFCANEGQTYTFNQKVDVAYGANGKFNYKYGVTGAIVFNNATFGDPIAGVAKKGYYKLSSGDTTTGGIAVNYTFTSSWAGGATVNIIIKNNSSTAVNGWTLAFNFPGNQKVSGEPWSATYTQSGTSVTLKNLSYNGTIGANGGTVSLGFNISYSGANAKPTAFTLNGKSCTTY